MTYPVTGGQQCSPNNSPVYVRCRIQHAWGWCTGMTQRDVVGREVGGGFMFGNACTPVVDSCQCMAKPIQYYKVKLKIKKKRIAGNKRKKNKKLLISRKRKQKRKQLTRPLGQIHLLLPSAQAFQTATMILLTRNRIFLILYTKGRRLFCHTH